MGAGKKKEPGRHEYKYRMLGRNIAYYREKAGYTQMTLAEALNISRTHMSNIEAEGMETAISLKLLCRIAQVLQVPAADLLDFQAAEKRSC